MRWEQIVGMSHNGGKREVEERIERIWNKGACWVLL